MHRISPPGQRVQSGYKSGDNSMSKTDSQQQGFLGYKMRQKWPLSCRFALCRALRSPKIVARFQARKRDTQAPDLRFYGAPKGIRILIVLVTVGDYWDSLVQLTTRFVPIGPNEYQQVPRIWATNRATNRGFPPVLTASAVVGWIRAILKLRLHTKVCAFSMRLSL